MTEIIATLVLNKTNTFSGQSENTFAISSHFLCEHFYQGYFPNGGEFWNVIVQEDEKAVTCLGRTSYGGAWCEKFQW